MPKFSEDDVVDYQVGEAVMAVGRQFEVEEQERAKKNAWKKQGLTIPAGG